MPEAGPSLDLVTDHAEETAFLWLQRTHAVHAPNYAPQQFADLDERLTAHIDGLRVAGDEGWHIVEQGLETDGPEDFFPAAVLALEATDGRFERLVERVKSAPDVVPGIISALGWVSTRFLAGRVTALIDAADPLRQKLGIAACALHRKDPGAALDRLLDAPVDSVRIRAARSVGELGRADLAPRLAAMLEADKLELRYRAARSLVLLGARTTALDTLAAVALAPGPRQQPALELALRAMDPKRGHVLLRQLEQAPGAMRLRIIGAGHVGDPRYVPWLIEMMAQPALARIAAEAFVNITGADFNLEQLEVPPPDGFEDGPTEDPDDENVELPEDIALPWPDRARLARWWDANRSRFTVGRRYFLGEGPTHEHSIHVLKEGFQRHRVAAAEHLCLLQPGTPLFNTAAPAWRQQRLLGLPARAI